MGGTTPCAGGSMLYKKQASKQQSSKASASTPKVFA